MKQRGSAGTATQIFVMQDWMTMGQVAEYLQVTTRTVMNLIARGELDVRRIGSSRSVRISASSVEALLK